MGDGWTAGFPRREIFRVGGSVVAGGAAHWLSGASSVFGPGVDHRTLTVRESANLCVSASPDGRGLALDVASGIWVMPSTGGEAHRITPQEHDATRPHWSPDGSTIVFQSFLEGRYDVWSVRPDGTKLTQLTSGPGYDKNPRFSPDGKRIALSSDRDHRDRIWMLDLSEETPHPVTDTDEVQETPAWSPDGTKLAYVVNNTVVQELDLRSGKRTQLAVASGDEALYSPTYTPDGRGISYIRFDGAHAAVVVNGRTLAEGEDLPPLPISWITTREFLYTAGGRIRRGSLDGTSREIPFLAALPLARTPYRRSPRALTTTEPRRAKGIANPVLSRDGSRFAFRALNALWLLPIGGQARKLVDDGYFTTDPDFAPDGRSLVYVSDRAGTANLWRLDLDSGRSERLTDLPDAQLTPRFSPDGSRIAYQDESGAIWVLDVASRAARKVLPSLYQPGRPSWSPDGTTIALAALRPYSRGTAAGHNHILTVDLVSGEIRYQAFSPERSLSTRGDDGPVWTSDGRFLVVGAESLAWRVPVDASGTITGPAIPVTSEVTDSLSLSGDGHTVAYLSNGVLRLVGIDGGPARTVPVDLDYRQARVTERTLVRAGALWDGSSELLRRDVDIVVRDNKIEAILPRSTGAASDARVVDASRLTVIPGLIDTHNHWNMRGKQWGDRQGRLWLAFGVTTSRSPGDPAYQMLENREAIEAGARVGPRYLGSGEALDGTRASYNCMRTTMSPAQLERELDRAMGLDYDLLKSYMRLPVAYERQVVRRAHAQGTPATSHYLYPAAHIGLDGMEHPGGGHRLGYSRTLSFHRIHMSQDCVDLLAASGMWVSSTMIFASELFAEDRSLINDERTRVLYPDWEYRRLVAKANAAGRPGKDTERNRRLTKGMANALLRVHRAGGLVTFGTDAPLDDIGVSAHQNLRAMVKYGFTPREALLTATTNAAHALGYGDQLGTVAAGRIADLVILEGDPLTDIHAAAAVHMIMTNGVVHDIQELLAPFRPSSGTATETWISEPAPSAAPNREHYWHVPEWRTRGCCAH